MQNKKSLLISVVCGGVCALCVVLYMLGIQGQIEDARADVLTKYGGDQVEVCVATRNISPGETIAASDIETKLWVSALLPEGAMRDKSQVVGSTVASSILEGEVVSSQRLGNVDDLLEVPTGLTAISVPAKNVQAVGGAISPGQKVDLYSTGDTTTSLLGYGLLVLATSASKETKSSAEIAWITLAVKPSAVQELVAAAHKDTLYFVLPGEGVSITDTKSSEPANGNTAASTSSKK